MDTDQIINDKTKVASDNKTPSTGSNVIPYKSRRALLSFHSNKFNLSLRHSPPAVLNINCLPPHFYRRPTLSCQERERERKERE